MLTLDRVALRLGDFDLAADLSVAPGLTAVVGPSGGGKSTFLALVAGFVEPDRGRILWQDRDLSGLAPGARPVAMLFQDGNLFPHLDIRTNVALGLSPRARPSEEALAQADAALARVGLDGAGARKPGALSGGQQSRAALARTLLTERPVVCLDEPFAALGPALRAEMLDLTAELLRDRTVLLVTHHPDDARRVAPRTILVAGGRVHPPADTVALFDDPPPLLRDYLA